MFKNSKKGSVTVEAALIIPFVLVFTVFIVMLTIMQYEKSIVKTYSEQAAYAIATYHNPKYELNETYVNPEGSINNSFTDKIERVTVDVDTDMELYWRVVPDENYDKEIFVLYNALLDRFILFKDEPLDASTYSISDNHFEATSDALHELEIDIQREGFIINNTIVVSTSLKYKIPYGSVIGIDYYTNSFTTTVPVTDNAEFVRNYNLVIDLASNFPTIDELMEKVDLFSSNQGATGISANSGIVSGADNSETSSSLSEDDEEKLASWIFKPDVEIYLKYKDIFDNEKYYNQETGEINWPPNDGFEGESKEIYLQPDTVIDRYGNESGNYVSPVGTPYEKRALAPGTYIRPYHVYKVIKPLKVDAGEVAEWFDEDGGGIQYMSDLTIEELIEEGYIEEVFDY